MGLCEVDDYISLVESLGAQISIFGSLMGIFNVQCSMVDLGEASAKESLWTGPVKELETAATMDRNST